MRILYFLDDGQFFGGAANTLLQQAILMKCAGHEVALVISNYEYETLNEKYYSICLRSNIEIMRVPFQISTHPEDIDIICLVECYNEMLQLISHFQPDILHSIQLNPVVEMVSRELGIPHIMNIYQIADDFFSVQYVDIFPHYHICDSDYYKRVWEQFIKLDSICIRTVVNKDIPLRVKNVEKKEVVYCCIGSITKRKNQLEIIKAFQHSLNDGVQGKLIICGHDEGMYAQKCKDYVSENNLEDFVVFAGFKENIEEEYEKADVLLCGSTNESYPNVISEAMAYGLVVISTPVAGVPEVVKDGINGYLCEGYLEEDIYRKIVQYDREKETEKILQMKINANKTFAKEHSPVNISGKLEDYYNYVKNGFQYELGVLRCEDLMHIFGEILSLYKENSMKFSNYKIVQRKLWYIYHIKKMFMKSLSDREKKIYIWGTGKVSIVVKEMVETFFEELQVDGFIDTYKQGEHLGYPIYSPQSIINKDSIIFIGTINGQEEIIEVLKKGNKKNNRDYFVLAPRIW